MPAALSPARERLDLPAVAALLLCCALWGLNQVAIKAALPEVPALIQLSIRTLVACALLLGWMQWRGVGWSLRDGTLWPGLLAGVLFAVEFGLIFIGLQYTTAARSVVFINTSPFIVALMLAWLLPAERLRPLQTAGLVIAFAGVAFAFSEPAPQAGRWPWLGDTMIIVAAVLWGLTTMVLRGSRLSTALPEKTLLYQLLVSGAALGAASFAAGEALPRDVSALSGLTLTSLAFQTVIVTFGSYLVWFWLVRHYPATRLSASTLLTPVFGLLAGVLLLGEPATPRLLLALVAVAIGIALVNRRPRKA